MLFIGASRDYRPVEDQSRRAVPMRKVTKTITISIFRAARTLSMLSKKVDIEVVVQKEVDALKSELPELRVNMRTHLKELGLNV